MLQPTTYQLNNYSGVRYNERPYNERMLQRRNFINKIRMLQLTNYNGVCYNEQFLSIKKGCYNLQLTN